jgi:glycosyltransferase involved in cell wall biosynthesis
VHVLQLLPALNQGGIERHTVELNRELVRRGYRSSVISAGGVFAPQIGRDGGEHLQLDVASKNPLTAPWRAWRLRRALRLLNPDLVHVHSRVPAWLNHFANRQPRRPVVSTVHGFNRVNRYSAIMTRADAVIYQSTAIRDHVLRHYAVLAEQMHYVTDGIDMEHFDPEKVDRLFVDNFVRQHDLAGKYVITIVGRITPWKGHESFIRAVAAGGALP